MTAVVFTVNDKFRMASYTGSGVNINSAVLKMMIITAITPVPNQNTDEFISTLIGSEVTGTGYTARGNACTNIAVSVTTGGLITIDCADPAVWLQNATGFSVARYAVLYNDTGVNTTSRIIATSANFGADKGNVLGNFSVTIGTSGIFTAPRPI